MFHTWVVGGTNTSSSMAPRVFLKPPIDVADVIRGAVTFNVPSFESADTMDSGLTPKMNIKSN